MLKVVPDEIMRALELRKGTVDLVVNDLSPDVVHQLATDKAMAIAESPGTDYAYVGFNMRDPVLRDRRVRHAIGYAIDRQAIVDHLRRGLASPAVGILPPVSWAFEPNVFQFTHDVAKARALLDEAGYPDPDGDGPAPRLRLTLKVSTNEFIRLQAAVIQQDLKQVGIELDVRSYEFATLYADVLKGNFQLFTLQWVGRVGPRHAAPRVSLEADAAVGVQSRLLRESRGRSPDRRGVGGHAPTPTGAGCSARRSGWWRKTRPTSACGTRPTSPCPVQESRASS